MWIIQELVTIHPPLSPLSAKAAQDPNAAWAAYYAQYYGQQPGGAMPAQNPGAPGAAAPGEQSQAAQASGGQPDYTKAWEEYYKKMGMSKWAKLTVSEG